NQIAKSTTGGSITEYAIPTANAGAAEIISGPDGFIWFSENGANKLGRSTLGGTIVEYSLPTGGSNPVGLAYIGDGSTFKDLSIWVAEDGNNAIGRSSQAGTFDEVTIPTNGSVPRGVVWGPDSNVWFTEKTGNKIGKMTWVAIDRTRSDD